MQTSPFVEALLGDLAALASIAPEEEAVNQATRRLSQALAVAVGPRLIEALSDAAIELSARIPSGHIEVRMAGSDPELVYVEDPDVGAGAAGTDSMTARVSLRLSETLKARIERAAESEGVSLNSWIVRALDRSVSTPRQSHGTRLRGYATS